MELDRVGGGVKEESEWGVECRTEMKGRASLINDTSLQCLFSLDVMTINGPSFLNLFCLQAVHFLQ